nr:branched-chain amino acid ABC transporter ATP-binding protein/permease [Actinomycetota bacterium]
GNFPLAFVGAGLVTAAASVVIGLPALRIRGLLLAVTTLGFAVAAERWLLPQSWMLGSTKIPGRPIFNDYALDRGKSYYLFAVVVFTLCLVLSRNVWRSGLGRRQRALRDNEDGARAFSVPATRVKLETFAVAGFLAGVGGALYGHTLSALRPGDFAIGSNIEVVALVVIGGIGLLAGPLLGALYIIGIPRFFTDIGSSGLAATSAGWLLLILYFPSGLAHFVRPIRERAIALALRFDHRRVSANERGGEVDASAPSFASSLKVEAARKRPTSGNGTKRDVLVEVRGLRKSFGGVHAVDGVDLDVERGETLGLIGPNGAGKTTLFELIGGFTRPDDGRIMFDGHEITRDTPERRAERGVIRSFQDAALFPTLTVIETIQLALERRHPTGTVPSLLGLTGADKSKYKRALELVDLMGLGDYADKQTGDLSTGTRRITELTCVIALEPTLLLLDEPSSGVAQRETEALGALLARVKSHLGATLIVIEHDMPLITAISDRIVAMESGLVIANGTPEQVMADPGVLEAYLGGDMNAVARSGVRVKAKRAAPKRAAANPTKKKAPTPPTATSRSKARASASNT